MADELPDYSTITIANGLAFADGLTGAFLDNPILLTELDSIPASTKTFLDTNNAAINNINIVGGDAVVSAAVATELAAYGTVTRLSGATRYTTATAVAEAQAPEATTIIVARGDEFPDALASGPLAVEVDAPIILNAGPTLRSEVTAYLDANSQITDVYIVGGESVVPATVEAELEARSLTVERLAGLNRDETAVAVANELQTLGAYNDGVILANRLRFPDAMVAGPLGADRTYPILLVDTDSIPASTAAYHVENCSTIAEIVAVGGTTVISAATLTGAVAAATCGATASNETFTANPELLQVTRSGDIVTFKFDQMIPGKALDFFNTFGAPGSLTAGDEVSYYTGLRLYDVAGTAYYAQEAGIFGDEVRARFVNAATVAAAVRAGVYEDTVQNAVGRGNPASDFPLAASLITPDPIPPYFPQLTFVGNLRDTPVTPAEIVVDYTFTFPTTAAAAAAFTSIGANLALVNPDDFALVGSAGQVFRAVGFNSLVPPTATGTTVTATVVMDPAIEEVPVTQLRRGFVEEDTLLPAGLDHILLSKSYQSISEVNGTTSDPDLRTVERGPGANQLRFIFDEAVSVPDALLNQPDLYTIVNNSEDRATPSSIGRSLIAADNATVMVATFTAADIPAGYATVSSYLNTVTAASVDVFWFDGARTVVAAAAARGTDQVGSQQLGWSLPAQVLVTPVQPAVPTDPTPGVTALPDLVSVTKTQNAITGNWRVVFTFDQATAPAGTVVDFSLYDAEGVRFAAGSRDIAFGGVAPVFVVTTDGRATFTFGPDVQGAFATFSNEQIEAAVLGTVQDADADLTNSGSVFPGTLNPKITEGHDGV